MPGLKKLILVLLNINVVIFFLVLHFNMVLAIIIRNIE